MSEPTTAAGRKMLGVLDSLMAVLHGIATADLPENIAAHAKTTDQVKEELAALVLAIEAEAATPAPLAPHPGEHHDYDMTCCRCGEPGYLFVGFHSPGETFTWSGAQPKEADRE